MPLSFPTHSPTHSGCEEVFCIKMKYVQACRKTGHFRYRRRVPEAAKKFVGKSEFNKVLGKTEAEALVNYGQVHKEIEHIVSLAKHGVLSLSPHEKDERLRSLLKSWGYSPDGPGVEPDEVEVRGIIADDLISPYQDKVTGEYVGVPEDKAELYAALDSRFVRRKIRSFHHGCLQVLSRRKGPGGPRQSEETRGPLAAK